MSINVTSDIWSLQIPSTRKILLLKLADCANDSGRIQRRHVSELARTCGLSLNLAQKILRELVESGILVIETCEAAGGHTAVYWLNLKTARSHYGAVRGPGRAA